MKNDMSFKIKNYLSYRQSKKNRLKQKELNKNNNEDIKEKFKKFGINDNYPNNKFIQLYNNKTDFINLTLTDRINQGNSFSIYSINDFQINNNEENIKEDNNKLFLEINQLKKEINLYQSRLNELTNEYNKLNQEYQENLIKNCTFEEINKEKDIEKEFIKLEEEKYSIKLKQVKNKNDLLKKRNEKIIKHNQQMKNFYKIYMGEEWVNHEKDK